MARPRIELDILRIEELAAQGLTQAEICLVLGIGESTLYRRKLDLEVVTEAIKRGKAKAASEISNVLYQMAQKGDLGAIVWYEKTRRGLTDKVSNTNTNVSVDWEKVPAELRDAFIEGRMTLDDVLRKL